MNRYRFVHIFLLFVFWSSFGIADNRPAKGTEAVNQPASSPTLQGTVVKGYGQLPLSFEPNVGQTNARVKFLARGSGYTVFLTSTEAVLALNRTGKVQSKRVDVSKRRPARADSDARQQAAVRIKLEGASILAAIEGQDKLPGKSNYFIGNDPRKWRTNIPTYAKVTYRKVYPGIDLTFHANQGRLEYDFIVAPGANTEKIQLAFESVDGVEIDKHGDLVLNTPFGAVHQRQLIAYQNVKGARREIACRYLLKGPHRVGFQLSDYDASEPLIIDPVFVYSSYLGGTFTSGLQAIAADSSGNAYVAGFADTPDFPTVNAEQPVLNGNQDVVVAKLNSTGSALVYSTYLGGSASFEFGKGIAVDSSGNAYVTGITDSTDFPTVNAFQTSPGGIFVAKLSPSGSSLLYSTYLGGGGPAEFSQAIAIDNADNAYVTGATTSSNFPTTANAFQKTLSGIQPAFVTKLSQDGTALIYSTFLGGSGGQEGMGIAVDLSGNAYVTGLTDSTDFPTINAIQSTYGGGQLDAFVTKLNPTGTALVYSTYLGGSQRDDGDAIAVDASGNAYVTGLTGSMDFPTANAFQPSTSPGTSAWVAKLSPAGSALIYSTYLGGPEETDGVGIAVEASGSVYVAGVTASSSFPTVNPIQPALAGFSDAFVAKLNPSGSALLFSTFLGGSVDDIARDMAIDGAGNVYLVGETNSEDFPTANALQTTNSGAAHGDGGFVTKLTTPIITSVPEGQTATISAPRTANGPEITATLSNNTIGSGSVTVTVDKFSTNPETVSALDVGGGFVDLFVTGADPTDIVTAKIYYPPSITGADEAQLQLLFFNGSAWLPVRSSGNTDPVKNETDNLDNTSSGGRFTVIFDNTSTPAVTQLTGTLFTPSLTPSGDIRAITSEVGSLSINHGQKNSLAMKLQAASQSLAGGNRRAAANQLQAFIDEMNALIKTGRLPQAQGQLLIDQANSLAAQLGP
jgi:hypothetical protein